MQFDEGWGMAARWLAWQSAGCPGVNGDNGAAHAWHQVQGNVRVVSLGVGCGDVMREMVRRWKRGNCTCR